MKGSFQESLGSSDVQTPERIEFVRPETYEPAPPLDVLKKKLEQIFHVESSNETVFEGTVLEENSPIEPQYVTLADGTAVELPEGESIENLTLRDDNGDVYFQDGKFIPDTTYELNGVVYTTDGQGRPNHFKVTLKPISNAEGDTTTQKRDMTAQKEAGGEDRRPTDQGGHLVGHELGGDSGPGNLVAMDARINQSDYKRMENQTQKDRKDGKEVTEEGDITYTGDSKRPDTITVAVTTDGKKTVYKFDNNMDGRLNNEVRLDDAIPEDKKAGIQADLNDTNGVVSSIKEEYDENGERTGTIVTITYTDENGNNYRIGPEC